MVGRIPLWFWVWGVSVWGFCFRLRVRVLECHFTGLGKQDTVVLNRKLIAFKTTITAQGW